jgi:nitrile hydratase beta subunit
MNGIHDIGGMDGFGKIDFDEPLFYDEWEKRTLGMTVATLVQGKFIPDKFRQKIERMGAVDYLTSGYFGHWVASLEKNLIEVGLLDAAELDSRTQAFLKQPDTDIPHRENPELVQYLKGIIKSGGSTQREVSSSPQFQVGQRVKTNNLHPTGHTRLPRYARGKFGVIHAMYGAHVFPDANANDEGESPQHLYSVCFDANELWGIEQSERVYLDLWESYLEPDSE